MFQPCSDMSDMGMGPTGRGLSTRRKTTPTTTTPTRRRDDDGTSTDMAKQDQSLRGVAIRIVRLVLPHVTLFSLFFLFLLLGAVIFSRLEAPSGMDFNYNTQTESLKNRLYDAMSNKSTSGLQSSSPTTKLPPGMALARVTTTSARPMYRDKGEIDFDDDMQISKEDVDRIFDDMVAIIQPPDWKIARVQSMQVGRAWTFPSSLLFCMTTITTIGYGDIVPVTAWGRAACIIYSTIGIPLSLIFLADIGNILARLMLFICRRVHSKLHIHKRIRACCGQCRSGGAPLKNPSRSTSKTHFVNDIGAGGDVVIVMSDFDKPPKYSNDDCATYTNRTMKDSDENKNASPMPDHSYARSVSIATEQPTSHPRGVTSQPIPEFERDNAHEKKQCQCEHQCDCAQKSDDYLEEVPLILVVVILAVYICGGAAMMASSEGWDYGTGFYFMFVTLTTIGFGDVLPMNHYAQDSFIPCIFFTLFGLAIMSMCFALVQLKILRLYTLLKTKFNLC